MLTFIWIEGEKNLNEFCMKRFGEKPHFMETCGNVGFQARVRLIYKEKPDGHYSDFYLLYMEAHNESTPNTVNDYELFSIVEHWNYDQIAANRHSILRK